MIASPPAVHAAPPPGAALDLHEGFVLVRAAVEKAKDPKAVLKSDAPAEEKLAALDLMLGALHGKKLAKQRETMNAFVAAWQDARQPPAVRARALTYVGYGAPAIDDGAMDKKSFDALLSALADADYRIHALRGMGPAAHGLPDALEERFLDAILGLLDRPVTGDERVTALVALFALVSSHDDMLVRKPALARRLDERVLARLEDAPRFVADPLESPESRSLFISVAWSGARLREQRGHDAAVRRLRAAR
jgi:hypothetical protein